MLRDRGSSTAVRAAIGDARYRAGLLDTSRART